MMSVNAGSGPPVVFVAQLGVGGASWKPVVERLQSGAVTAVYDRPGTGDAPARPAPNPPISYRVFAGELLRELERADIVEPVVLVGHSVGSLVTRAFAGAYPARVAGMVHVDGSIPRLFLDDPGELRDGDGPDATVIDWLTGEAEILTAVVPQVPTVVISRTPGWWLGPMPHPAVDEVWHAYQRILARDADAPRVVAGCAGHQIPRDAPALVAHLIDAVVEAVRSGKRWLPEPAALTRVGGALDPEAPATSRRTTS